MSCKDWEERIALHAGGDLTQQEAAAVERHLAECAQCRETAAAYGWGLDWLREAHREPIAEAHYAAVRARVLAELWSERPPIWRRVWGWGLVVAAVVVALVMFSRPVHTPARRAELAAPVLGPAATLTDKAPGVRPAVRRRRPTLARAQRPARPTAPPRLEAVTIKLLTGDPNVIIYWIADRKGE